MATPHYAFEEPFGEPQPRKSGRRRSNSNEDIRRWGLARSRARSDDFLSASFGTPSTRQRLRVHRYGNPSQWSIPGRWNVVSSPTGSATARSISGADSTSFRLGSSLCVSSTSQRSRRPSPQVADHRCERPRRDHRQQRPAPSRRVCAAPPATGLPYSRLAVRFERVDRHPSRFHTAPTWERPYTIVPAATGRPTYRDDSRVLRIRIYLF